MKFYAKPILKKAQRRHYAVPAFNVSTLEQIRVIVETAKRLRSPIIIETSEGESSLITYHEAAAIVESWRKVSRLPIILNADHHHSFEKIKEAVDAGYSYVHIDASLLRYKQNVRLTSKVVKYAHARGVLVEGELGNIGGSSERHRQRAKVPKGALTKPEEAVAFARATRVDALAANIGNIHGLWQGGKPHLAIDHVKAIRRRTKVFLTLHGGSGIPNKDVKHAIRAGITKMNMNTELRVSFIGALRHSLRIHAGETTPYKLYPEAMDAMAKVVEQKIRLCGSAGKA